MGGSTLAALDPPTPGAHTGSSFAAFDFSTAGTGGASR